MDGRKEFLWSGWSGALCLLAALTCNCAGRAARDSSAGGVAGAAGAGVAGAATLGGQPGVVEPPGGAGGVPVAPFAACERHADCVVTHRGCCAACGDALLENVVAVGREELLDYRDATCGQVQQPCSRCSNFWNPYLVARCVEGQCAVLDLFQPPFVDCQVSDDCRLRANTCCPCEENASLISVSAAQEGRLRGELCDADSACDDCASVSVTDVDAGCREGRCVLLFPPP